MMASSDEIRGDWNNLKGTHYHLLYALWLLLRNEAANVYFYEGNDLLARLVLPSPTVPPDSVSLQESDDAPAIALYAERATTDIWIQLKSTKSSWSCSRLFDENLLTNFICNGFQSEARNRTWRASLITQGMVKQEDVKDFVNSPQKHPVLNAKLDQILESTRTRLQKEGWSASETSLHNLRRIALEVLSQLSDSEPIVWETLKSDVNAELTRAYPDQEVVRQLEDLLIGAFIRDTAPGPVPAKIYDSEWINIVAGKPIVNRGMFDQDPVAACSAAVDTFALEIGFDPKSFALRGRLQNSLERFIASDKTLFVIAGLSGSGKSWSCADWALHSLGEELRLLIPGHDIDHHKSLGELVQNRLKPSTSAFWPPEQFLKRLAVASELEGRKPFTAIIDDLIPVGDVNVYRRDLARIVAECRSRGFKIVLTCQRQLWDLHQLGIEISSNEVFVLSSETSGAEKDADGNSPQRASSKGQLHSFTLADFSPEEQRDALSKRLSPDRADDVADHFRLPGFTLLRNPYLLSRYLEWHHEELSDSGEPPPFSIDELLDWYVNSMIERAATELSCSSVDIAPAFGELVEGLWVDRGEGLPLGKAVGYLANAFPEKGSELLQTLKRVGLITSSGPIRLADALIADRLFALRIQSEIQNGANDILDLLSPEADSGVVTALIRNVASDSIFLSEYFLARNSRWAGAVALGLAQGPPNDWRALALLTSLLTSEEDHVLEAGYSGLGQIGARGQRAWKWLAELYLGDHAQTWHRGSRALANSIEYIPNQVEAAIRTRLTRLLHIDDVFSANRDRLRSWLLNDSLDPLRGVTHQSSAAAAQRIVNRYASIADPPKEWFFINDLDHARGRIALFGDGSNLTTLLENLNSDSAETRYRAVYALRIVAAERPALVKTSLISRISEEPDFQILARLLLISFHLIASYSDELLSAINASKAGDLNKPLTTTGVTLSLLGNLASKHTEAVESILPWRLELHPSWARAFSTEMLAYAWWRCAETSVSAKNVLDQLSNPDLVDVPDECIPFVFRGSAIALLGLIAAEQEVSAAELTGHQTFYPKQEKQFLYLETVGFFQKNVNTFIQHKEFDRFIHLLLQSVIEEEKKQVHPIYPVKEALFRCSSMCIELVVQTAAVMYDPLLLLRRLPRNWQAIRGARRLLELGRHDESIVKFARESYVGLEHEGTTQALEERRQCQAQLALLETDSANVLNEQRQSIVKSAFIHSEGNSLGLATAATKQPENLLSYLEDNIQDEHDLPTLYYLVEQARTWPTLLVARLYSRMFNSSSIGRHEAADLCEQILAAVRSLPHSFIQGEYESVYSRIYELLSGNVLNLEPAQRPVSGVDNLIRQSHRLSTEILAASLKAAHEPDPEQHLSSFLYDTRGWLETGLYALKHNLLLQGTSYMMYFFPAVRLSLVAAGAPLGLRDLAGGLIKARAETARIINDHSYLFHAAGIDEEDNPHAQRALADLQNRATVSPDDERLPDTIGTLLLLMNRFNEAETALKQSLSLPLSRGSMRAHTLKNLACVYARVNHEAGCQAALEESGRIEPLDQKWLNEDTDLEAMRDRAWFKTLTNGSD